MNVVFALLALDMGDVFRAVLVLAFFVVPILRQVLGDRTKTPAPASKRPSAGPRKRETSGWEDLLREQFGIDLQKSEPEDAAEQPMAESVPVSSDPASRQRVRPTAGETLSVAPAARVAPATESVELGSFDTGLGAIAAGAGDLASVPSELGVDLASVPSEIGELANVPSEIGRAKSGDLDDLVHSSRTAAYALDADASRSEWRGGDWRRAIVLNEILGTPVALREGEGTLPAWR